MSNCDAVVDDERRPVARLSMPAIVASRIALFPQEGCHFPPSPDEEIHHRRSSKQYAATIPRRRSGEAQYEAQRRAPMIPK